MRCAICPGSFDPVTVGHVDIIARAAALFDKVIVLVAANSVKQPMFTAQQRVEMLRRSCGHLPNVQVQCSDALLAEFARSVDAVALVKGVRDAADLAYEQPMAYANRQLNDHLDTVLLPADPALGWISSTIVRELLRYHQNVSEMVPAGALALLSDLSEKGEHQ